MDFLDNDLDISMQYNKKRPVFLLVLCILTFVGSGFSFLTGIYNLATFGTFQKSMSAFTKLKNVATNVTDENMNAVLNTIDQLANWFYWSYIMNMVGALIAIIGAVFLLKRYRIGFVIYVFAQLLIVVPGFGILSQVDQVPFLGFVFKLGFIIGHLFTIGFIIMYATQLKQMWWKKPDYI